MNANNIDINIDVSIATYAIRTYSFAFHGRPSILFYTTQLSKSTLLKRWRRVASTDKGDVGGDGGMVVVDKPVDRASKRECKPENCKAIHWK
jgi:hypothetical protein